MISRSGMLAPLVAVLVWADRKLNIGGRGRMVSAAGPQMDCSRRGHRQPGIRLTGVRRAPYSIRTPSVKALSADDSAGIRCRRLTPAGGLGTGCALRAFAAEEHCMPGAGTDKTKRWVETPGPVVVLVEPQLGENIGAAARAMANFGLSRLRLVKPRQSWPNEKAQVMAAGADRILDGAELYDTLDQAIADCSFVLATTARAHDQAKPVIGPAEAARQIAPRVTAGETVAIVFGRERNGLENDEVALADRIVTLPVNPAFASLNLAQAIVVIAYEWFKLSTAEKLPFGMPDKSAPAPKQQLLAFFAALERELEKVEFFRPPDKRETMQINLRNIFSR